MAAPDLKDVLIVDDDNSIRSMLAVVLGRLGLKADVAVDGADAIGRIRSARYAVVLVDLMMPRVDGAAFVVALRAWEKVYADRPVVLMMTAMSATERLTSLGDSVQACVQKPFDVLEVAEVVRGCVDGRRHFDARPGSRSTPQAAAQR